MTTQPCDLTIVLPLCKPKNGWAGILAENMQLLQQALPGKKVGFIVVNDGFETLELCSLFDLLNETFPYLRVISYKTNMGKGYALRTGVNAATSPYVITTDADFPYSNDNIVAMYASLLKGADVVAGVRSSDYYRSVPFERRLISKGCVWLNKRLLHLPDCDTQSGLKGFNVVGKNLFLYTTINRFLVDTEFMMLAYKRRLDVSLLELQLKPGIRFSAMGVKVLVTELRNLFAILKKKNEPRSVFKKAYYEPTGSVPHVRLGRV